MAADTIPPPRVVVALDVVNQFFPEVTQTASTGENPTAIGNPIATRSVIYANGDISKKVTISVDEYESISDASLRFGKQFRPARRFQGSVRSRSNASACRRSPGQSRRVGKPISDLACLMVLW